MVITGIRTNVPEILTASDLFVLSSLWEGMPLSLLEAMAASCPAIATDVGGGAQVLHDGTTWLIRAPTRPTALARAIGECLDHPEEARKRAHAAGEMVRQKYSMS